ncbi:unnamed protein product [Symbiodinium sp. KB8]|nr:unnamed protein product [Symbiodinium sp. KB8]
MSSLMGCYVEPVPTFDTGAIEGMKPVYEEDLVIQKAQSRTLINPGKILTYGPFLLVTERAQGIHVYDNSDPANPVNLFFVDVMANNDITIRNGLLYLDNGPDLVALKVTADTLIEVSRARSLFETELTDVSEFPAENNVYYECPDEEKGSHTGFTMIGDYLYAISFKDLTIYNIGDSSKIVLENRLEIPSDAETIFGYQHYLLFGRQNGISVYDVGESPTNPVFLSEYDHQTACDPVIAKDGVAYFTIRSGNGCGPNRSNRLVVLDISDPTHPILMDEEEMKAIGQLIDKPIWMPKVTSLEESFDRFFFWGEMILRDFDEIDQYLVEADQLFTSIKSQKELDEEFYFLDEEELKVIRLGYGGQIYRLFWEGLKNDQIALSGNLILAGFNALTSAEAITSPKRFNAVGVSLEVGQVKALAEHLESLAGSADFVPEKTVIVIPNEYMLFPLLHAIPPTIEQLNITMGYPMKDTPVFSLLESLLQLQSSARENVIHGASFYHRPVIEILGHPLIHPIAEEQGEHITADITKRNLIFVYQSELKLPKRLFELIFSKPVRPLAYLLAILEELHHCWKVQGNDLELEFISRFYQHTAKLEEMIGQKAEQLSYDFLIKLFRRLSRSLKIPFSGEPLEGLQIMGVLETRNLDFENVFILNMNEGSWPAPPKKGSFIPYNIRKAFDLPVFEHQDSIYAYLFYRLLQRSRHVWFYYNTVSEFNVNGEMSRYIRQLAFETNHEIHYQILANPIAVTPAQPIHIEKSAEVMFKLGRFLVRKGEWTPRLTPSALDTYLYCRLRFYFKYVQELYEPDELQEELSPMVFGNILHDTMEILYKQFLKKKPDKIVEPNDFFWLESGVDGAINKAFIKHYDVKNETKFKLEGRNIIAAEIIRKTALKILHFDQQYAPFKILGLETSTKDGYTLDYPVTVNGKTLTIGIKGKIDRLDQKQGKVRVIDYKTGKDAKEFGSITSMIDRDDPKRNKAAFQVFFYSYLFYKTYTGEYTQIEPGLFNSRDLFDDRFSWQLIEKAGRNANAVGEFRDYLEPFEEIVTELLSEIYHPDVPFDQVEDESKCRFCPYEEICGRG